MWDRLRLFLVVLVVLAAGAFLGSAWDQQRQAPATFIQPPAPLPGARWERVRVEVLNAGGRSGMARAATQTVREGGFDVVYFGNAADFGSDSSVVIARVDEVGMARAVADLLGIRTVLSQPDSNLFVDVTVRIGEAWTRPERAEIAEQGEESAWWDVRRFFRETEPQKTPEKDGTGER